MGIVGEVPTEDAKGLKIDNGDYLGFIGVSVMKIVKNNDDLRLLRLEHTKLIKRHDHLRSIYCLIRVENMIYKLRLRT